MRHTLLCAVLAALALPALVACGASPRSAAPSPAGQGAPTADPREVDPEVADRPVAGLDLRDLPTLPVLAAGERRPTVVSYETAAGVAEGVAFYREELGARGWAERAGEGYVQEHAGLLVLEKENALLSVSVSDLGDSRAVSLLHHGAADVGALPVFPGAEVIFAQSMQLIYATPAPVAEVAGFTREQLAAQGWIAYRRPFTAYADDPALQQFSLTRNGASLSVMVAVAPAQGGKTTVQYVVGLLPVNLPLPADAADLELDAEAPYASYTTAAGPAELAALYRAGMGALGWREAGAAGPDGAALRFRRREEEATLELSPGPDGRTAVLLSPPGPDVDPASAEMTELGMTPEPAPLSTALPDGAIPLPADAYDVEADPAGGPAGSLRAASPSPVAALLVFYRAELPRQGWAERVEAAEGDARRARLVFLRPGAVLRLELREMADGATAIRATTASE